MSKSNVFKTYSNLSNAKRAIKNAKLAADTYVITKLADGTVEVSTPEAFDAQLTKEIAALLPKAAVPNRKAERAAKLKSAKATTKPAKQPKAKSTTSQAPANRLRASTIESPVKLVWAIADSMPAASRKEVLAACEAKGIAYYTARTQYQCWKALLLKSKK